MPTLSSALENTPSALHPYLNNEGSDIEWDTSFYSHYVQPLRQLTKQLKECVDQEMEKMQFHDLAKFQINQFELTAQQAIHSLTSILTKSSDAITQQLELCDQVLLLESVQLTGLTEIFDRGYNFVHHKQYPVFPHFTNTPQSPESFKPQNNFTNTNRTGKVFLKEDITSSLVSLTGKSLSPSSSPTTLPTMIPSVVSFLNNPLLPTLLCPGKLNLNALHQVGIPLPSSQFQSKMSSTKPPLEKKEMTVTLSAEDIFGEADPAQDISLESK
ncbi:hypothetical protein HMI55_001361, partial [Coelomomyces lativittatus]